MNEAPISTWTVLYTKQKLKKSKTWSDGFLRLMSNRKLVLLDSNQQRLDTFFHKADSVQNGDSLETDAYLIEVDCEFNEHAVNPVPSTNSTALIQLKPVAHASHIASVKKFVPPRVISAPQSAPSNSQSKNILSAVLSGASQNTTRTVALPSTSTTQLASAAPLDDKPAATGERNRTLVHHILHICCGLFMVMIFQLIKFCRCFKAKRLRRVPMLPFDTFRKNYRPTR
jgi:hypothetical protein